MHHPAPPRCTTLRTPNNQSAAIAYVTLFNQSERGYSVRHAVFVTLFNQSEHGYSVHHAVFVTLFNQSERGYSVRHAVFVPLFNQSERGYSVRHAVFVTLFNQSEHVCAASRSLTPPQATSRSLTQPQATSRSLTQPHATSRSPAHPCAAIAYVTLCSSHCSTNQNAAFSHTNCAPLCAPLCAALRTPKKGARSVPIILLRALRALTERSVHQ